MSIVWMATTVLLVVGIYLAAKFTSDRWEEKFFLSKMPPVSVDDVNAASTAMTQATLPMVPLAPNDNTDIDPLDTRLGGQPWAPDGSEEWPHSEAGVPMCFLGQVNFAQIPPIDDFPHQGLLQVFADVASAVDNNGWSMSAATARNMANVISWFPDPKDGHTLARPDGVSTFPDKTLVFETDVPSAGLNVDMAVLHVQPPAFSLPRPYRDVCFCYDRFVAARPAKDRQTKRAAKRLEKESFEWQDKQAGHRIGGHPIWLMAEQEKVVESDGLDRVLLQLQYRWDAKNIFPTHMTLAIRQDDLRCGRLEKARFFWAIG